jgi:hypothetical protein
MPNSLEQIAFLCNTSAFDDSQNSNSSESAFLLINAIDFHLFNSMTKLFKPDSDVNFYNHLIGNLKRIQLSDSASTSNLEQKIAVLVYIILFNFQYVTSSSTNAEPVKSIRLNKKLLFENFIDKDSRFGLREFLSTLSSMSTFFDCNVSQEEVKPNDEAPSPNTR